jgi:hypothetical protein
MPTQRYLSPHRILPLVLTIPLLLLFGAAGPRHAPGPDTPSRAAVPIQFERHDLPAGWDDDVLKDALPAPPADDDQNRRKLRVTRVVLNCEPSTAPPLPYTGTGVVAFSAVDCLMESLLLGRPPPPSRDKT